MLGLEAAHGAKPTAVDSAAPPSPSAKRERFRPGEYTGIVTYVTDGDTLWVALPAGTKPVKVRIEGIDAPEICQAWGPQAKEALQARLLHRAVTVKLRTLDSYGRRIGKVFDETEDIGQRLVKDGHAWSLRFRWDKGPYMPDERMAQSQKLGLHAQGKAVSPRDFRKQHGSCKG